MLSSAIGCFQTPKVLEKFESLVNSMYFVEYLGKADITRHRQGGFRTCTSEESSGKRAAAVGLNHVLRARKSMGPGSYPRQLCLHPLPPGVPRMADVQSTPLRWRCSQDHRRRESNGLLQQIIDRQAWIAMAHAWKSGA